ncbi:BatD family protein [Rubripirellula tenax]|uniref:BatD family protein n=1 Tax=Rubripirellula tenax TaxID=2528015 RepID=UPI0011B65A12|nr:BatD family protein [Rubripirellula tenax]
MALVIGMTALTGVTATSSISVAAQLPANNRNSQTIVDGSVRMIVTVDPPSAPVATPITLTLDVEAPKNANLFPQAIGVQNGDPPDDRLGDFEVTDRDSGTSIPVAGNADRRRRVFRFTLVSLRSGTLTIPPIRVSYQMPEMTEGPRQLTSQPFEVNITSLIGDDADPRVFREIKPLVPIVAPTAPSPILSIGLTAIAIGAVAGYFVLRRRPTVSAQAWANDQLNRVEQEWNQKQLSSPAALNQLTGIIRRFVEHAESTTATSMATHELIETVNQNDWPSDAVATLSNFLRLVDQQKFAGAPLGDDESVPHWIDQLRELIHNVSSASPNAKPSQRRGDR